MDKETFSLKVELTISDLLESAEQGVYKTTKCFAALDDLYDIITDNKYELSWPQQKSVAEILETRMVRPKDRSLPVVSFRTESDLLDEEFDRQAQEDFKNEKGR